jgi:hypothetical protein
LWFESSVDSDDSKGHHPKDVDDNNVVVGSFEVFPSPVIEAIANIHSYPPFDVVSFNFYGVASES